MHVAVIECDEPLPELKDKFGTYTTYFSTLLHSSLPLLSPTSSSSSSSATPETSLSFTSFEAYRSAPLPTSPSDLEPFSGLLFTGSRHNAYDSHPWILKVLDLIRLAYGRVKMVGICFGHQLIARALGGTVAMNPAGWEIAVTSARVDYSGCPGAEEVLGLKALKAAFHSRSTSNSHSGSTLGTGTETGDGDGDGEGQGEETQTIKLHQMHRDIVTTPPPSSTTLLSNTNTTHQSLYHHDRYFSIQGHPEFNAETVDFLTRKRMAQGVVSEEVGVDALGRVRVESDGVVIGGAILRFLSTPIRNRVD